MTSRLPFLGALAALLLAGLLFARPASAGYTHYWRWRAAPEAQKLTRCIEEMDRIANARRSLLADTRDRTGPEAEFRSTCAFGDAGTLPCIAFNGIGDAGHETFAFPLAAFAGTPELSFVKTAQKPYDEVAVAALIVARDHFPPAVLQISSDGTWMGDWMTGAALYERVLGRPAKNPITEIDLPPAVADPFRPDPPATEGWSTRQKGWAAVIAILGILIVLVLGRR